ncbi:MAG: O-antigen ligase family protein, partial [Verrucomicrobiota bacterium]
GSVNSLWRELLKHPALWISLALVMNVLEGALRKWVPGFGGGIGRLAAYFSKDIIFGIGVLCLLSRDAKAGNAERTFGSGIASAALLLSAGSALSLFHGFNLVGTALSLRALVVLPFLVSLYVSRVRNFPLLPFASIVAVLTLANLALGLLQTQLPADHILNRYAAGEMAVVEVEYGVRATGTFAYITGLSVMSAVGVWAGMVVVSLGSGWKYQALGVLSIIGGLGCAFASISRGPVVIAIAMLGLWAFGSVRATRLLWRMAWLGAVSLLAGMLLVPGIAARFLHLGEGSLTRFSTAGDDNVERAVGQWRGMARAIKEHPWGLGPGTEQAGGNYAATGNLTTTYEDQFPRIVAEFGIIGLLGFFLLVIATVWTLQVAKREIHSKQWSLALTATQVFVMGQAYTGLVFNHTASAFAWLIVAASLASLPAQVTVNRGRTRRLQGFKSKSPKTRCIESNSERLTV